jgi:hypothetical protein
MAAMTCAKAFGIFSAKLDWAADSKSFIQGGVRHLYFRLAPSAP